MHLSCQTAVFFAPVSVVESYRYMCRLLHHLEERREFPHGAVANLHHPLQNQCLTPGVGKSNPPVAKPRTFLAAVEQPLRPAALWATPIPEGMLCWCMLAIRAKLGARNPYSSQPQPISKSAFIRVHPCSSVAINSFVAADNLIVAG